MLVSLSIWAVDVDSVVRATGWGEGKKVEIASLPPCRGMPRNDRRWVPDPQAPGGVGRNGVGRSGMTVQRDAANYVSTGMNMILK